jgi:hypothetical protein
MVRSRCRGSGDGAGDADRWGEGGTRVLVIDAFLTKKTIEILSGRNLLYQIEKWKRAGLMSVILKKMSAISESDLVPQSIPSP